jgi:predicted deacylase
MKKSTVVAIIIIVLVLLGIYFLVAAPKKDGDNANDPNGSATSTATTTQQYDSDGNPIPPGTQQPGTRPASGSQTVLGESFEGREILAYHFGDGETDVLFVGGIHGGYEWNTSKLAYEMIDHLEANSQVIPDNIQVTIIPVLNPDGLVKVTGTSSDFSASSVTTNQNTLTEGRFNANDVDLNRNFDCDWKSIGIWQQHQVSGGSQAFSEPESKIIKSYVESVRPEGVVVWYSAAGGVYASACLDNPDADSIALTNAYAKASGYPAHEEFDAYEVNGDMVNWLAKINIPAISVLLTNHTSTEFSKNKAGVEAILKYFAE